MPCDTLGLKTIRLLGELGRRFGREHRLAVGSPAEAVRALCANFKDFRGFVSSSSERGVGYKVLANRVVVGESELHSPTGRSEITIAPVLIGAGGSLGQIIVGVALIATSYFVPGIGVFAGKVLFSVGVALALGGVSQMLSPQPKTLQNGTSNDPTAKTKSSYAISGPLNVSAQGIPVPVGYGRLIVGSAVISAGITVDELRA